MRYSILLTTALTLLSFASASELGVGVAADAQILDARAALPPVVDSNALLKRSQSAKLEARDIIAANNFADLPVVMKKRTPILEGHNLPVNMNVAVEKRDATLTSTATPTEPTSAPATIPSDLVTPDNIAENTYTVEEGCIRYHTVKTGEICLGLLDYSKDLNLTLDELYCLNPAIDDDLCYNLQIDVAYCIGYNHSSE